jgi:hypothetical protein
LLDIRHAPMATDFCVAAKLREVPITGIANHSITCPLASADAKTAK